jgi:branched-chain amino acid transport system ATP-binding protein
MKILEVKNLSKNFGGLKAVSSLDFQIENGEIVGLVGPNGAGKTTVFNLITGIYNPTEGKIFFQGKDITGLKPHKIAQMGIARTFQLTTIYKNCTVLENVIIAQHYRLCTGIWGILLRTHSFLDEEEMARESALKLIDFVGLSDQKDTLALNLSHGSQRRLEIAIALSPRPELLLLDEPVCGMNPEETIEVMDLVSEIRNKGTTILMIEHDMKAVMDYCDRILVLNYGQKLAEGTPQEIKENKEVIEAYLGKEDDFA